jgi:hypothetical protein
MTKDEALKMAIDCLEYHYNNGAWGRDIQGVIQDCKEALATNKESSLVQPEQEPVAWQWLKSGHMRKKIPKTATPEHWRPLYTKEQL